MAEMPPCVSPHPEIRRAVGRVDDRGRHRPGPTEGLSRMQLLKDRLGQGNVPAQRRVHRVVKERVVEHAVRTYRVKKCLTIDQNATQAPGDVAIDLLKRGQCAHRVAIVVSGRDKMRVSFVPVAGGAQEQGQAIMRLGEAGLRTEQAAIAIDATARVARLAGADRQELTRECLALGSRYIRRQVRPVRFEAGIVGRRCDEHRDSPDTPSITRDGVEPVMELLDQRRYSDAVNTGTSTSGRGLFGEGGMAIRHFSDAE